MKIICSSKDLYEGLQVVGNIAVISSTKPILQAVKIETVGDKLELSTTDLEVGIRYLVESKEVVRPGSTVIPKDRLAGLLKEWSDDKVEIEVKGNASHISGKGCSFKLVGYAPEEFPTIPTFVEEKYFEMEPERAAEMVKKTVFASASERLRHTMTGVLLNVEGGTARMVATDGRRLAIAKERIQNAEKISASCIIPNKGVQQLPRIIGQGQEPIKVRIEETHMMVKTSRATLCSQLIEGQYPNYEEAVPKDCDKRLEMDAELLASALRRATFLTTEERHVVRLKLTSNRLTVSSETPEVGEGQIELEVNYSGGDLEIGFNPDFLLDALKALGRQPVKMEFKEPNTAAVLKAGQDYLYVVMPIRLTEV